MLCTETLPGLLLLAADEISGTCDRLQQVSTALPIIGCNTVNNVWRLDMNSHGRAWKQDGSCNI